MNSTERAELCKFAKLKNGRRFCRPNTKPGDPPTYWQELGWAKRWLVVDLYSCTGCKRFERKVPA